MMEVSWQNLFIIPLVLNLVALSVCGIYYTLRRSGSERVTTKERIYRCAVCGHVYVDARMAPLMHCPRCKALNEAVKR